MSKVILVKFGYSAMFQVPIEVMPALTNVLTKMKSVESQWKWGNSFLTEGKEENIEFNIVNEDTIHEDKETAFEWLVSNDKISEEDLDKLRAEHLAKTITSDDNVESNVQ
jgi:hypothetical protein